MATSLLNGCALVIDDQITDTTSTVSKIVDTLEAAGTLFVKYTDLPSDNTRANLSGISFIILDWDIRSAPQADLPEGVQAGGTLSSTRADDNNTFIKEILKKYFVPIFIFTNQDIDTIVKPRLEADTEIKPALERRVFVERKANLSGKKVKTYLKNWLKSNQTVFALKMFEEQLNGSKNAFLVEVGDLNSKWANLVYNTIKLDHIGDDKKPIQYLLNLEFQEFLMNSLLGRMNYIDFRTVAFDETTPEIPARDTHKIYESIKFYKYGKQIDKRQAYEGDIYQRYVNKRFEKEYLININAPCDLRKKKMLLIVGKKEYCNKKKSAYKLPFFADESAIGFWYEDIHQISRPDDLSIIKIIDENQKSRTYKRIGRITHPYITAIRNEFAHFISRQGIPRHPKKPT
jgi:hypothetical protein